MNNKKTGAYAKLKKNKTKKQSYFVILALSEIPQLS